MRCRIFHFPFHSSLTVISSRYKKLIALLFYLLDRGQRLEAKSFEREQCCRAAGLYFVLLSLPGSGAFSIFHPVLFNRALDTFKLATKLRLAKFSPKKKRRGKKVGAGSTASSSQQQKAPRMRHASRAGSTCSSAMVRGVFPKSAYLICHVFLLLVRRRRQR